MLENLKKSLTLSKDYMLHDENSKNIYFLFNITTGEIFKLNSTSFYFIKKCDGVSPIEDIFDDMSKNFAIDIKKIKKDFNPLLNLLIKKKILL